MSGPVFRLARPEEAPQVLAFVNANFDWKLPVVNLPEYFDFYYRSGEELQFAIAEEEGRWLAVAGYIRASAAARPDLWVSVWVAVKGQNGVGLELMAALPGLTGAGVVACNNIRPKTMAFYRFLGWQADRMGHFYRLAPKAEYKLARPADRTILPVSGDLTFQPVDGGKLEALGLPASPHTPQKDIWYVQRRYFAFPHLQYQVYAALENGVPLALLAARVAPSQGACVLRIVDFIGDTALLPRLGRAIDGLLLQSGAEYAECYCAGVSPEIMAAAGFCERAQGSESILPNYLDPPLYENTEYYYFTSTPEGFVMFKADGDQDRPNLSV